MQNACDEVTSFKYNECTVAVDLIIYDPFCAFYSE